MVEGAIRTVLRVEGLALLAAGTFGFYLLDLSWWMFAVLFFAPDLSFITYLAGPRVGAFGYNTLHTTIAPMLLGLAAWLSGENILSTITLGCAAVWLAHIGFDRMLGYGLKYASGFKNTHLGRL